MPLFDPALHPFANVDVLAIAVCRTGEDQRHVGLIYCVDDQEPMLCDLAWHYRLRYEPPEIQPRWARSRLFWRTVSLHEANKRLLVAVLEEQRIYGSEIPYGFDVVSPCFTPEGIYVPQPPGKGLTCVTFIIEIYKLKSLPLLIEETWPPRPDDVAWQNWIIEQLEEGGASVDHIEAIKNDIGVLRIRPEEAVSAVISDDSPVTYGECLAVANDIKELCA